MTASHGRPAESTTTSQSRQFSPAGAPSALATASLAANRAASDSGARGRPTAVTRSSSVNNRSTSIGVRSSARANRSTNTTSTPTPMITAPP
ncbi:hypothetical protein Athai_53250 [Actinocatenispora thailandica]|uniref:Uncharacterized protein n=1 Tax=Actinocatenispora thailandica TaxID=227318 RepID=A0A7R7HZ21_9ACTN|nr:hypothetical protein Athai_53250 [Actinocatenispora thailandica]